MVVFISFITIIHGILYIIDEYVLNKKRGLTQFEINSASLDGMLYLVIVGMTLFTPFGDLSRVIYFVLCFLSCLSIIKNELFYPKLDKFERLVHAGLYVLHPLILYVFYISWQESFFITNMNYWMLQLCYFILGFKAMTYHVIYWNYMHGK